MKKWGKEVREIDYPIQLNDYAHTAWCSAESTIYYCDEEKIFYIHEKGKRKPIVCKTPNEVTEYYLQFIDISDLEGNE